LFTSGEPARRASWMATPPEPPRALFERASLDPPRRLSVRPEPRGANLEIASEEARPYGAEAGLQDAHAKVESLIERYVRALSDVAALRAQSVSEHAASAISLGMLVAREIVGRELATDPRLLTSALEGALRELGTETPLGLRMNPDDHRWLVAHRPELLAPHVTVSADPGLAAGGFVIEASDRSIDASIETRLDGIAAHMTAAMVPKRRVSIVVAA